MTRYQPIWLALLERGEVTLEVDPGLPLQRVKKGVITAKYKDMGFKMLNEEIAPRLQCEIDEEKRLIKFKLRPRFGFVEYETER
jgi:hypothetical protein